MKIIVSKIINKSFIAFLALSGAQSVLAQGVTPSTPPKQSLPGQDPFSGFAANFVVSTEEGKASTDLSYAGFFAPRTMMQGAARRNDLAWNLGLSIPVGGESDLLSRGTLDNLGNGLKFSAGITLLSFQSNPTAIASPGFLVLMQQARAQCARDAGADQTKVEACAALRPAESEIRTHTPWLTLQMNRALFGSFWTLGTEGAVSVARYSYIETPNLTELENHKLGYSGKIVFNNYFSDAVSKLTAELEYSDAPESVESTIICKPIVTVPADDCKSGAPKPPSRKEALVFRGGYARYFPFRTGNAGIGVQLTASKDILSDDWAIEVPVYLTIPGVTQVSPGVKASYGSIAGKTDFTANIFIRTSFSF